MTSEEFNIIKEKVTRGVNLAVDRLIQKTIKEDGDLVYLKDGKIVRIKARNLKK
jgi:hypothetical protein